jgi:hypothetical protein
METDLFIYSHVRLMTLFLTNNYPIMGYHHNDYDHRFFYIEDDKCNYICGLVQNCMADYLYEKKQNGSICRYKLD